MENKTKIILNRKSEWMNRARTFQVYIDGNQAGRIKNDSGEEFTVAPGKHVVQCKIDWCSSQPVNIDLRQDEKVYLKVQSGLIYYKYFAILIIAAAVMNIALTTKGAPKPSWFIFVQIGLIIPALCYIFYYITFGRKHFLLLQVDKDNLFA